MSYLRCNVRSCSNSFTQRGENYSNVVSRNSQAQPETDIQCDVINCSYNKDLKCAAASVDISGSTACTSRETQCSTFDCKQTL